VKEAFDLSGGDFVKLALSKCGEERRIEPALILGP
jgi:hypothetical protein